MSTVPQIDLEKIKALPRVMKLALVAIAVDLAVVGLGMTLLDDTVTERLATQETLRGQIRDKSRQLGDLRKIISQMPEMKKVHDEAIAKGLTTPPDVTQLDADTKKFAEVYRLSDLDSKFDPEELTPLSIAKYNEAANPTSLTGTAYLDTDVLSYWDQVLGPLSAHYQVTEASLERIADVTPASLGDIRKGKAANLVRAKLAFRWVGLRLPEKEGK